MTISQNYLDIQALATAFDNYNRMRQNVLESISTLQKFSQDFSAMASFSSVIPSLTQTEIANILLQSTPSGIVKQIS